MLQQPIELVQLHYLCQGVPSLRHTRLYGYVNIDLIIFLLCRFQEFYDNGERETMMEEILNLRDQVLDLLPIRKLIMVGNFQNFDIALESLSI